MVYAKIVLDNLICRIPEVVVSLDRVSPSRTNVPSGAFLLS